MLKKAEFQALNDKVDVSEGNVEKRILSFLDQHPSNAWTSGEIQRFAKIKHPSSANAALVRLEGSNAIRRKVIDGKTYWTISSLRLRNNELAKTMEEEK